MDVETWSIHDWDDPWSIVRRRPQCLDWWPEEAVPDERSRESSVSSLVQRLRESEQAIAAK
jgi:hypothetical protein